MPRQAQERDDFKTLWIFSLDCRERSPLDPEIEMDAEAMWVKAVDYHEQGFLAGACIGNFHGDLEGAKRLG